MVQSQVGHKGHFQITIDSHTFSYMLQPSTVYFHLPFYSMTLSVLTPRLNSRCPQPQIKLDFVKRLTCLFMVMNCLTVCLKYFLDHTTMQFRVPDLFVLNGTQSSCFKFRSWLTYRNLTITKVACSDEHNLCLRLTVSLQKPGINWPFTQSVLPGSILPTSISCTSSPSWKQHRKDTW